LNIIAANPGSYPRIGDKPGQQRLRRALPAELDLVRQEVVREVMAEQAKAGLDVISDGQVRWADPVSHPMGKFAGVSLGGLLRYQDTNTYFRQPVVAGALAAAAPILADEVRWSVAVSPRPVAVTLLGPLTLSRLSLIRGGTYATPDALMDALVPVLADEVERLAAAGVHAIVIEEPRMCLEPEAFPRLADAFEVIAARRGSARLWVFPSFGDAGALWDKLQSMPVDGLVLDLTRGGAAADALAAAGSRLAIMLGLVDARSLKLETAGRLAKAAAALLKKVRAPVAGLVPSAGLEYLPRGRAYEKCVVLAKARDLLTGRTAGGKKRSGGKKRPKGKVPRRGARSFRVRGKSGDRVRGRR